MDGAAKNGHKELRCGEDGKVFLTWEDRFDDVYWDGKYNEAERIAELKDVVLKEREDTIKDVLERITSLPIRGRLTDDQEKVLAYIRRWFNTVCIPGLVRDYRITEEWL